MPATASDQRHLEQFSFERWDLNYELELIDEVAAAHVTEELVAQFPEFDQNRGLVRALPLRYEGAPAAPEDISVVDESGAEVPFETQDEDDMRVILIGGDDYVHGEQTYQLSYTLENVVYSPSTSDVDEFTWDLVPAARYQPIDSVSAQISMSPEFSEAFTGETLCTMGTASSTESCEMNDDGAGTLTLPSLSLERYEGLAVSLEFDPGTVPSPSERESRWTLDSLPILLGLLSAGLAAAAFVPRATLRKRHREDTGGASAQRGIPENIPLVVASAVAGFSEQGGREEIFRLVIRGVIGIEDSGVNKGAFARGAQSMLRLLNPELARDPMEYLLLEELFPSMNRGDTFILPLQAKERRAFSRSMRSFERAGRKQAESLGLLTTKRSPQALWCVTASVLLIPLIAMLLIFGASRDNQPTTGLAIMGGALGLLLAIFALRPQRVHTHQGAVLLQQLTALQNIIIGSENRHDALLQAEGQDREAPLDAAETVHLYDEMIPFAALYSLEEQWAPVVEAVHEEHGSESPAWLPTITPQEPSSSQYALYALVNTVHTSTGSSSADGSVSSGGTGSVGGGGGGGFAGGR